MATTISRLAQRGVITHGCCLGRMGTVMLERLLEPGSPDLPNCVCGSAMPLAGTQAAQEDTEIRIFRCPRCQHELRLTVWREPAA